MRSVMWLTKFNRRELVGVFTAPLIAPGSIISLALYAGSIEAVIRNVELIFYLTVISYFGMVLLGVPLICLLKQLRIESVYWYMFGGALIGGFLMYFLGNHWQVLALAFNPRGSVENIEFFGAFTGGAVGLAYAFFTEEWTYT